MVQSGRRWLRFLHEESPDCIASYIYGIVHKFGTPANFTFKKTNRYTSIVFNHKYNLNANNIYEWMPNINLSAEKSILS